MKEHKQKVTGIVVFVENAGTKLPKPLQMLLDNYLSVVLITKYCIRGKKIINCVF